MPVPPMQELTRNDPAIGKIRSLFANVDGADMMIEPDTQTPEGEPEGQEVQQDTEEQPPREAEDGAQEQEGNDSPDDDSATPKVRKTKLRDKEYELPEEVADELEKGTLRMEDYTRKTQATAAEKKALDAEKTKVASQAGEYANALTTLRKAIEAQTPKEPDWNALRREVTPEEFQATLADWQIHERKMNKLKETEAAATAEANRLAAEEETRLSNERYEELFTLLPDWKDEAKGTADRKLIVEYATQLGYSVDDLATIRNPKLFVVLLDAAKFRALKAGVKPSGQPKGKPASQTPVLRPGAATAERPQAPTVVKKLVQAAKKSGSVQDAAAAIRHLPGVFD